MRFSIEVFGEKLVDRQLMRFAHYAGDPAPAFESIVRHLETVEREQFSSSGGRSGGWPPLKEATIAKKRAAGLDNGILRATGALEKSLTGGEGRKVEITPEMLVFGTSVHYAVHHQFGAPRANVPKRPVVDLVEPDRREVMLILQRHIIGERGTGAL